MDFKSMSVFVKEIDESNREKKRHWSRSCAGLSPPCSGVRRVSGRRGAPALSFAFVAR